MIDPPSSAYGDAIASDYDWLHGDLPGRDHAVRFLAMLAQRRRTLELGIGTGRIALPLRAAGVPVEGLDASSAMVDQLRARPGGADVPVVLGDMEELPVEGRFGLVYVVFNTLFAPLDQDGQVRCLQAVARHLEPDGAFVTECFVPDPSRYVHGQNVGLGELQPDGLVLHAARHDPVRQRVDARQVILGNDGTYRVLPVSLRYAWPAELDLMARLAGLRLAERYGGWRQQPFDATSTSHVSVYVPA